MRCRPLRSMFHVEQKEGQPLNPTDPKPDHWYPKNEFATAAIKALEKFIGGGYLDRDGVFNAANTLTSLTGFIVGLEHVKDSLVPRGTISIPNTSTMEVRNALEAPPRPPEILIQVKGSLGAVTLESLREMLEDETTHSRFHNIGGISPKKRAEYLRWAVERYAKARAEREVAAKKKKNVPRGTKKRGTK